MAPITRRRRYQTPSPSPLERANATTTRKSWYYNVIDQNPEGKLRRQIADDCGISKGTGRY
jgi:hypothetical protein